MTPLTPHKSRTYSYPPRTPGATLHYATELIGSSFRLQDNPQAKDGGACGCGVSWEAKEDVN